MSTRVFEIVRQAIKDQKSIRVTYTDKNGVITHRTASPHILANMPNGTVQVLCYHVRGESSSEETLGIKPLNDFRNFYIDKLEDVEVLDEWMTIEGYFEHWKPRFKDIIERVPDIADTKGLSNADQLPTSPPNS